MSPPFLSNVDRLTAEEFELRACDPKKLGMSPSEVMDIFFPLETWDATKQSQSEQYWGRARSICHSCPILARCAKVVLANRDVTDGMVGGMTANERRKALNMRTGHHRANGAVA